MVVLYTYVYMEFHPKTAPNVFIKMALNIDCDWMWLKKVAIDTYWLVFGIKYN